MVGKREASMEGYSHLPGDSADKSEACAESKETTLTAFAGIPTGAVVAEMFDFLGGTTTLLHEDNKLEINTVGKFTQSLFTNVAHTLLCPVKLLLVLYFDFL